MSRRTECAWWPGVTVTRLLVGLWSLVCVAHGQESPPESVVVEQVEALNQKCEQLYNDGKTDEALPVAKRALETAENAIAAKNLDPLHPAFATALNNLGALSYERGDYGRAERLYTRALEIRKQALGPEHPELAESLNNLAALYRATKDYERAERLLREALAIYERGSNPDNSALATILNNLGALSDTRGDYDRAERLYTRALEIRKQARDPAPLALAESLNNLGMLYDAQGNYDRAKPLLEEALAIHEQALGQEHPAVATSLYNLALLYDAKGDTTQAVTLLTRAVDIRERNLALVFTAAAEDQKHAYSATLANDIDATVSLHVQAAPHDPQALRLALATVLHRKGRVLEAMADTMEAVRRHLNQEDRVFLDQLAAVRSQLAFLILKEPGQMGAAQHRAQVAKLQEQARELEEALSARSAEFRMYAQPVTLEGVQAAIPEGKTLVEMVAYRPFNPHAAKREERWEPRRYVAYLLRHDGAPTWVDLGEAASIDSGVARLRGALSHPDHQEVKALARALDEQVMHPIRALLGETRTVLLSLDGSLHVVPFGALVDENDRYLIETFTFSYLTTGRDLLRLGGKSTLRNGPVIVANPAFGEAGTPMAVRSVRADPGPGIHRSVDFARLRFDPLPGTADEAEELKKILPGVKVLTGAAATEAALKEMKGPRILHVATHGFFLKDQEGVALERSGGEVKLTPRNRPEHQGEMGAVNPLLRSGLVFAGANQQQSGKEDGVLTALEAAGLDLWGTQLVTLSACETGMGDVQNGEGVYGLRRAMVMAGAESLVMSLWKVADRATQELMAGYYRLLLAGEERAEGLRRAQLAMLRSKDRRHPFYWASFIISGDWASIDNR